MDDATTTPNEHALVPVREQTVDFYGDQVLAAQTADETVWVAIRPICDALGLTWSSQFMRIKRDPVLAPAQGVLIMRTPGGEQRLVALPLKLLPGWLFGIQANRVKSELREKILRYQQDCYEVLWRAFQGDVMPQPAPAPPADLSGAELAVEIAGAVYTLAQQQLALERGLAQEQTARQALAARHQVMADYMRSFVQETRTRLTALEVRLDPASVLTEAQAADLALAVKTVAHALEGQGEAQGYGRVYGELYRRYQITSYKNLPQSRLAEVLAWLHRWHAELTEGP